MTEICTNVELIAAAGRQGMTMSIVEAAIVMGYLEGHDYMLLRDDNFRMKLHDLQDGKDHSKDADYTIRDVIEFCVEMNSELLLEVESNDGPNSREAVDLGKDAYILGDMMQRAAEAVAPVSRKYSVAIVQTLKKTVQVEATSWAEAEEKTRLSLNNGDIILTMDDYAGVFFNSMEV